MYQEETDYKRLFTAIALAGVLLIGWQTFVDQPRRKQMIAYNAQQEKLRAEEKAKHIAETTASLPGGTTAATREEQLQASPRITIRSETLHGSIALRGARFDDLTLARYHETVDPSSPEVVLLSPGGDKPSYFAQAGWLAGDNSVRVPDANSLWQADKNTLTPSQPVTLRWDNGQGQTFEIQIKLDENYMFTISQRVANHAAQPVNVYPYAFLNRSYGDEGQHYAIFHEGPLGVMEGALEEISYDELRDQGSIAYENASGWLGITDKYWLTAMVPQGTYKATFSHYVKNGEQRYQTDYLGENQRVDAGGSTERRLLMFAGAKKLKVIDAYAEGDTSQHIPPIPLFDRAVDFGVLYFLTKPMFLLIQFFFELTSNFGVSILLLTVVVKLLMFPLANKSYHAMAAMRELQPEITKLRERHKGDAMKMNQEMMALYKREKVNPAAGCLPLLIQMPVFFALYKVLFVAIEMRHAPFFGWIRDLSAPDPSNIFTLFGILDWGTPSWLHLGILPILMCATMVIQMRQQPKPADPVQAKIMNWMPYFFLFVFAAFPAGLVLYWAWSNILSILQQAYIITRHKKMKGAQAKAKAA